jgi:hypothetical protein
MNIRMGTAFSTVDGYPSGLNTPGALTSPLKMLLSLRGGAPHGRNLFTREMGNLQNLVAYCVAGRGNNYNAWVSGRITDNQIANLLAQAAASRGLTMYTNQDASEASLMSCETAATNLDKDIENFMQPGGKGTAVMTAAAATSGAAPIKIINNKAMVDPITPETQDTAMQMLFQSSSNDAYNFMKMAMFMPSINKAFDCASSSGDPRSWAQCLPFQQAVIQYSEDSAAAGTFFQRLMFHGMNALFFLWICLSPVVAMVMLIMGIRGMKLAGSYLMFGAWAVSWYVGASIVNFYMLKQVQYEVAMLGQISGLTMTGIGQFFDVLQNKIAVSGDMMASVPLIMMTVMSGSVYGMVQLASRWGAKDYYDQNINSPALMGSSPLVQRESLNTSSYDERLGHGGRIGARDAPVLNESAALSNAISRTDQQVHTLANEQSASASKALQHTLRHDALGKSGHTFSEGLKHSGASTAASVASIQEKIMQSSGMSEEKKHSLSQGWAASFQPGVGGLSAGMKMDATELKALGLTEQESKAVDAVVSGNREWRSSLAHELGSARISEFTQSGGVADSLGFSSEWSDTQKIANQHSEAVQTLESLQKATGVSRDDHFETMGRQFNADIQNHDALAIKRAAAPYMEDPVFAAMVESKTKSYADTTLGSFSDDTKRTLAKLEVLSSYAPASKGFASVVADIHGASALTSVDQTSPTGEILHDKVLKPGEVKGASQYVTESGVAGTARGDIAKGKAETGKAGDAAVRGQNVVDNTKATERQNHNNVSNGPVPTAGRLDATKKAVEEGAVDQRGGIAGIPIQAGRNMQTKFNELLGISKGAQENPPQVQPESKNVRGIPK